MAFLYLFVSCSTPKKEDLYDFLSICNNEFYMDQGVNAIDTLYEFEKFLVKEGHLKSNEAISYKYLLEQLKKNNYFPTPLQKDNFSNTILYSNPSALMNCVENTFNIDTLLLIELPFYRRSKKINSLVSSNETIDIQHFFDFYLSLPEDEFNYSFVKENTLHFLYRWYFKSKYDRTLPITTENSTKTK